MRGPALRRTADLTGAGRIAPRIGTMAEAAPQTGRIELVAGERIAVASADDSPRWPSFDRGLMVKVGLGALVLLALVGVLSLAQRLLGL
jgi:hypothetical protein